MSTTWRKSGIIRIWKRTLSNDVTRPAASDRARMNGMAERSTIAMTRRVPSRYRKVRGVTTQSLRIDSVRPIPSPDQVAEDGFEAVVRTLETPDVELRVRDNRREFLVKCIRLAGADQQCIVRGDFERDDVLHPGKGLRQLARVRRLDAHGMRVLVDERADGMDVARGDCLPIVNQHNVLRDAL